MNLIQIVENIFIGQSQKPRILMLGIFAIFSWAGFSEDGTGDGNKVQPEKEAPVPVQKSATGATPESAFSGSPAATPLTSLLTKFKLPNQPKIMVIPINDSLTSRYGMIDTWMAAFVKRRLAQAKQDKVDLVIFEIETNGGLIFACELINTYIADAGIPTIAYVKGKAFSGGAIISLGCDAIVMRAGSQVGGAQAVSLTGKLDSDHREKLRSLLVAMVVGLCEQHGYPKALARGMVDMGVEIVETDDPKHRFITQEALDDWKAHQATRGKPPNIIQTVKTKGQILTLTAGEALNYGLASKIVPDRAGLIAAVTTGTPSLSVQLPTTSEKIARFLGNPILSVVLVIIGLIALFWEIKAPSYGLGFMVFGFCIGMMFWGAVVADSAGWVELTLFFLAVVLVAIEIFVLPGFGVAGISGLALFLVSIVLAFIPDGTFPSFGPGPANPFTVELFQDGVMYASFALGALVIGLIVLLFSGASFPGMDRIMLKTTLSVSRDLHLKVAGVDGSDGSDPGVAGAGKTEPSEAHETSTATKDKVDSDLGHLIGCEGVVDSTLRPAGKVRIEGVVYHANSEGGWIEADTVIEVVGVHGSNLLVRKNA